MANLVERESYAAGDVLIRDGSPGTYPCFVASGDAKVRMGSEMVALQEQGDCFGEMAILDGEPRSATVETMREARLLEIAREDFNQLLLARPQIGFALIKNLNRRLRQTNAKLIEKEA